MTLDTLIMLAGALVALIPFLGFDSTVDTWLLFFLGIVVISLGIVVRRRGRKTSDSPTSLRFDDIRAE